MELKQLRYAVAVADERHFGHAADRVHTAQSAVSAQVAQLERELGTRLFERTGRDVRLTDAGRVFVEEARATLRRCAGSADLATRARAGLDAIRIGFHAAGADDWWPEINARFLARRPGARIALRDVLVTPTVEPLLSAQVDVLMVGVISADPFPGVPHEVLTLDRADLLVPEGHPYAERDRISFAEVELGQLVTVTTSRLGRSCGTRVPFARTVEEVLEYVALGAVALYPHRLFRRINRAGVRAVPMVDGPTFRRLLMWRDDGRAVVEEYVRAIQAVARRRQAATDPAADLPS